jgi:hypothetical protein
VYCPFPKPLLIDKGRLIQAMWTIQSDRSFDLFLILILSSVQSLVDGTAEVREAAFLALAAIAKVSSLPLSSETVVSLASESHLRSSVLCLLSSCC